MSANSEPTWSDRLRVSHQYLIPQKTVTGIVHWLTRRTKPPSLKDWAIRRFVSVFGVDLSEAENTEPEYYPHFNAFFTRALAPGARTVVAGANDFACPVDGTVSQCGAVDGDKVFQAKGRRFSLTKLLGGEAEDAEPFLGGQFATLYLSPRDYHRIHMPFRGTLRSTIHVPGRLFSVSPLTTRGVPDLFARNERLVCLFETVFGPLAMVLVGATNVASIETVWAGIVTPPYGRSIRRETYPTEAARGSVVLEKGRELGRFNMGSTVIVVAPPQSVVWAPGVRADAAVKMGQLLGTIVGDPAIARHARSSEKAIT